MTLRSSSTGALLLLSALALLQSAAITTADGTFVNFESGHVRPLALSYLGQAKKGLLFAVNTPDNRLEIFRFDENGLEPAPAASVPVGLEPVAVAVRSPAEVWVVNHLSDSVSVVRVNPVDPKSSYVERTILLCDEPRDIVFAGKVKNGNRGLAFITTARRGQNCPIDAALSMPGVGRGVVQVFDASNLAAAPGSEHKGAEPLTNLVPFGDVLRPLAATPDGTTVYAGVFLSGNRTTAIHEQIVSAHGGPAPPAGSPPTSVIVKANANGAWKEHSGDGSIVANDWSAQVELELPDHDVFVIDAMKDPPQLIRAVDGVGTVLFNLVARNATLSERVFCNGGFGSWPTKGCRDPIYASNLDSRNHVRFEPELRGHIAESRVTRVKANGSKTPHHLNPHITYSLISSPPNEIDKTLAFPMGMAVWGSRLYVAAFGSDRIAIFLTSDVDAGNTHKRVLVDVGRGPTGLVVDDRNRRLYVMNRIDQTISVVEKADQPSLASAAGVAVPLFDPSPDIVKNGRPFLYDARATSAHGDAACASCHIFGDLDGLAWDLGDDTQGLPSVPNPFPGFGPLRPFAPMKGPMTTQSLRGLVDAGPMHWRGDRFNPNDAGDELGAFETFNGAFETLLGRPGGLLPPQDMTDFAAFALTIRYPPNPIRALDNALTADQSTEFFDTIPTIAGLPCTNCHVLPLGTDGRRSFDLEAQDFKIAHLRNLYQKVGMFGMASGAMGIPGTGSMGQQVRGFGYLHDGSIASVSDFLRIGVISFCPPAEQPCASSVVQERRKRLEAFLFTFDTGLKPAVGQQLTVSAGGLPTGALKDRLDLLIQRDAANDCELVGRAFLPSGSGNAPQARGFLYDAGQADFRSDRLSQRFTLTQLLQTATTPVTFTCAPPDNGTRIGIDRDGDGALDGEDTAPTDPNVP